MIYFFGFRWVCSRFGEFFEVFFMFSKIGWDWIWKLFKYYNLFLFYGNVGFTFFLFIVMNYDVDK